MDIWEKLYNAAKDLYHPEELSPFVMAYHVVCALECENGEILVDYRTRETVTLAQLMPAWWGDERYEEDRTW